ncbi:imidazoleglycerol-phosphate dehydratase HisB [bacterium]|nr:imidazoleglycerol-phosphate dehydratase HisB [bacterium]
MKRTAEVDRKTRETDISVMLNLDGNGSARVDTGIGFLNHMLESLARHSGMDIAVRAKGDLHVDDHHTVEDVGLALGEAFRKALGDKRGITRFGWALCPMDEALARVSVDISGRPFCVCTLDLHLHQLGDMHASAVPEFFRAFSSAGGLTLHLDLLKGRNLHHAVEALFKALALALNQAVRAGNGESVPSTKGMLA